VQSDAVTAAAVASIRLQCEQRPNRSRISVDGRGLTPRTGRFRARVTASGGTDVSPQAGGSRRGRVRLRQQPERHPGGSHADPGDVHHGAHRARRGGQDPECERAGGRDQGSGVRASVSGKRSIS
jgi:hypothetical protein